MPIVRVDKLKFTPQSPELQTAIKLLESYEWQGEAMGPGYGPMDSGPGPVTSACIECGGINPNGGMPNIFPENTWGHTKTCKLNKFLKNYR